MTTIRSPFDFCYKIYNLQVYDLQAYDLQVYDLQV